MRNAEKISRFNWRMIKFSETNEIELYKKEKKKENTKILFIFYLFDEKTSHYTLKNKSELDWR